MSFRNRCQIAGAEGLIELSIPLVKGRSQKTLMKEVRIANDRRWQAQHWKTIVSCYSRSPWFEFYRDELEALYKKRQDWLVDWNGECFGWSLRMLKMSIPVGATEAFIPEYDGTNWVDGRGKLMPKSRGAGGPLTGSGLAGGIGGGGDMTGEIGKAGAGLMGTPQGGGATGEARPPLKYRQVFEERVGFLPNLSILDLLFCEGKEAGRLLAAGR